MDFVDVERRMQPVEVLAFFQPRAVLPDMACRRSDAGGGVRSQLEFSGIGVGLDQHLAAVAVTDFEFVQAAGRKPGNEDFPHSRASQATHGVDAAVPAVEVADHADSLCVGRPYREAHARNAEAFHRLRAQHAVALIEPAFAEKKEVVLADGAGEGIGVVAGF